MSWGVGKGREVYDVTQFSLHFYPNLTIILTSTLTLTLAPTLTLAIP
jgi:hypothetical protein